MSMLSERELAKHLKGIEKENEILLDPSVPFVARIDGRCFSTFTKNFIKPIDDKIVNAMINASKDFVKHFSPAIGYTASDEASFVFMPSAGGNENYIFSNRIIKIASVFSSYFTSRFIKYLYDESYDEDTFDAHFDCRIYNCSVEDALLTLHWRHTYDTYKNGVSALARFHFNPKELHKKNCRDMVEMIETRDDSIDNYKNHLFYGTYIKRQRYLNKKSGVYRTRQIEIDGKFAPKPYNLKEFEEFVTLKYYDK